MRSNLLKSAILVISAWWVILTLKWGLSDPETNLKTLQNLSSLVPFLKLPVPTGKVDVLGALGMQLTVLKYWTLPVLSITALSAFLGYGIIWFFAIDKHKARLDRETGKGGWRGVTITMGELPTPVKLNSIEAKVELPSSAFEIISAMSDAEKGILQEALGILAAHPDAFCGDGHGVSLYEHSLNVLIRAIENKNTFPLGVLGAALHDLGKITAFKKDNDGQWQRVKHHDKESAKHLALMDSWWDLDEDKRYALLFATKYGHSSSSIPSIDDEGLVQKQAIKINNFVHTLDGKATADEKKKVLEAHDIPDLILKTFLATLPNLPFQTPGLPKGVKAVGWKKKSRVYLLEIQTRERCMAKMNADVRAALGGIYREKTKIAPFSLELLKVLDREGWLVKELDGLKVSAMEGMWKLKAGTKDFQGVIILDLPDNLMDLLPNEDTLYDLKIMGTHFEQSGLVTASEIDMSGLLGDGGSFKKKKKQNVSSTSSDTPPKEPNATVASKLDESEKIMSSKDLNNISIEEPLEKDSGSSMSALEATISDTSIDRTHTDAPNIAPAEAGNPISAGIEIVEGPLNNPSDNVLASILDTISEAPEVFESDTKTEKQNQGGGTKKKKRNGSQDNPKNGDDDPFNLLFS